MIDKTTAKRVEKIKKNGRIYHIFIFDCLDCENETRIWPSHLAYAKQKCRVCASRSRPYQHCHTYLTLCAKHKNISMSLTYEEYCEYTTHKCHYCNDLIPWEKWSKGSGHNQAYYLDRIDNAKGYSKDNCVACCTECNFTRSNRYSYNEFMLLSPGLQAIKASRKDGTEYN